MPLGTQFGYSASGLAVSSWIFFPLVQHSLLQLIFNLLLFHNQSCVIRDLDASAPRPRLPPRALPDDVRERILRNKKKAEDKLATEAGFVDPNSILNPVSQQLPSSTKMSARAAARAQAEASLLQESKLDYLPKPALIARLTGVKAAAANEAAANAARARREAEAQSLVFGSKQGLLAQERDTRLSFGGSTLSKTLSSSSSSTMRRSFGGNAAATGVSVSAAAALEPRRMKM